MLVVLFKLILSFFLSIFALFLYFYKKYIGILLKYNSSYKKIVFLAWFFLRIVPFYIVFVVFDYTPASDVVGFYKQAKGVLKGGLVYRDFYSMYSPLFSYIIAISLFFWTSKKTIVLLMILFEGLALLTSCLFYKNIKDRYFKFLIYLFLPAPFFMSTFGAQEDIWMYFFCIFALLQLQYNGNLLLFSFLIVLGFLCTKAIFVFCVPVLLVLIPNRMTWISFSGILSVIIIGLLVNYTGFLWITQPMHESDSIRAPNILSILNPLTFNSLKYVVKYLNWVGIIITLFISTTIAYRLKHLDLQRAFSLSWIALFGTMMVVQPSSYANYVYIFMLPLVLVLIDFDNKYDLCFLILLNVCATVHPSLWWNFGRPFYKYPSEIFSSLLPVVDYSLQLAIIISTLYFINKIWRISAKLIG